MDGDIDRQKLSKFGFAKLLGVRGDEPVEYLIRKLEVVLGRNSKNSTADVVLGAFPVYDATVGANIWPQPSCCIIVIPHAFRIKVRLVSVRDSSTFPLHATIGCNSHATCSMSHN